MVAFQPLSHKLLGLGYRKMYYDPGVEKNGKLKEARDAVDALALERSRVEIIKERIKKIIIMVASLEEELFQATNKDIQESQRIGGRRALERVSPKQ